MTYNFSKDKYDTDAGLPKLMANDIYDLSGKLYLNKFESLPGLDRSARYNNESDFLKNRSQDITLRYEHIFNDNIKLRDVASFRYDNIDYFCTEGLSYLESNDPIYNHYYMKNDKKVYINLDTSHQLRTIAFQSCDLRLFQSIGSAGQIRNRFDKKQL